MCIQNKSKMHEIFSITLSVYIEIISESFRSQAPELISNLQDSVTLSKVFRRDIERPLKELRKLVRNTLRNVPGPRSRTSAPAGAYFETFPNELRKCFEPLHP
ncbi:hypothetical protein PGT21_008459 [Puccinia graminis f. sp. tritici]|uniref:Uncharacterized protein n=2 Tax=Puccinia graminis f. sp. tritici TaxID=56615 RepID=A0A5B0NXP1_PUCGR|nr:hypothetical protein PGT21_008459 [Puccinia graminis f. sp. tritici]KAA1093707.1 hypothetical protein PGTUg99_022187 [Puccinia graminis f. sp. tritici]KAA1116956.1 hypothetical protein PGTUg99_032094 [Puccinia graminis f. sp. tritici]